MFKYILKKINMERDFSGNLDEIEELAQLDLYKILQIDSNSDRSTIKKAYKKLVLKYHPDKGGSEEHFDAIEKAYSILVINKKRQKYDFLRKENQKKQKVHYNFKSSFQKHLDEEKKNWKPKDEREKLFNEKWENLDKKHGVSSGKIKPIKKDDAIQKMKDLHQMRENEKFNHEKLFDKKINSTLFNKLFEKYKEKQNNNIKEYKGSIDAVNPYQNFSSLNQNNLYTNDKSSTIFGNNYSSFNDGFTINSKVKKSDLKDIQEKKSDYNDHNKKDDNYKKLLEERMLQYNSNTKNFKDYKFSKFDENNFINYGFLDKVYEDTKKPKLVFNYKK